MKTFLRPLVLFLPLYCLCQDTLQVKGLDNKYVEDQFYLGITYNLLTNKPTGVKQNNVSYGLMLGMIKDFPLNKRRNVALGLGLGYGMNSYFSNLQAIKNDDNTISYQIISDTDFNRNKIGTHSIEFPVEFRWRTSTPEYYRFWRIYGGVKMSYIVANNSKFISNTTKTKFSNDDIRKFQYAISLSFGYNTWNFYADYQLSNLFVDNIVTEEGHLIDVKPLKIGLVFYIL